MNFFKKTLIRVLPRLWTKRVVQLKDKIRTVPNKAILNNQEYEVIPEKFWTTFNNGNWEPDLTDFFKNNIDSDKAVLDIGSWRGPSVLLAHAFGAKKVFAVEADPENFEILKNNCKKNHINGIVELKNICISDKTGKKVHFGYVDTFHKHSSTRGIRKNKGKIVETVSLEDYLKTINTENINLIKIDIEGGERLIIQGLNEISKMRNKLIFLSLHPPFWPEKEKTATRLKHCFKKFKTFDSKENPISVDKIYNKMVDDNKTIYPDKYGRFFDIILKT